MSETPVTVTIETEIYQSLENIISINVEIQRGEYSQLIKDNAMRVADFSLKVTEDMLSETTINKELIKAYKSKQKLP